MKNRTTNDVPIKDDLADRIFKFGELITIGLCKFLMTSTREAYLGYMNGLMPVVRLLQFSCAASAFFSLKIDIYFLKLLHNLIPGLQVSAPTGFFRVVVWLSCAFSPFLFWGWRRHKILQKLILFLQDVFTAAGLVSNGKTPRLIMDYETDTNSRVLQFLSDGVTVSQFKEKKELLENKLSVRIEDIRGHRQYPKLIEIEFAEGELKTVFELSDIYGYKDFTFPIGTTRSEVILGDLKKIPHYLFAGQTGSGKSTYIRTMTTVLLANNKNLLVYFIDLKGTEAGLFNGLPRLDIAVDEIEALSFIRSVKAEIGLRKEKFIASKVRDLDSYNKVMVEKNMKSEQLPRILLIIDEFANLMPNGETEDYKTIKEASATVNWIARIGRSFGINLVIGIQKPDTRNMDSTTKANLEGILCFQVMTRTQSQVVLDNNNAVDLGGIKGRAVWQISGESEIVQAPIIPDAIISKFIEENKDGESKSEGSFSEEASSSSGEASPTINGSEKFIEPIGPEGSPQGDSEYSEATDWDKANQ